MNLDAVKSQVLGLPAVARWPEMADVFERSVDRPRAKWEFPLLACRAVGGEVSVAIPGAAASACMQLSLVLVDDMLDEDPRGIHHELGTAAAANMAYAFQAAAFRVIEGAPVAADRRSAVYASMARASLAGALGQYLDAQNLSGEDDYWRVVQSKSASFFGAAFHIGALLGQAPLAIAGRVRDFGLLIGEIIQIYDDLIDALASPASPDWRQGRNNLAILYALTADHPDRTQFRALLSQVDDACALETAQRILVRCGSVSYCAFQVIERYQAGQRLLDSTPLADPAPLAHLLESQREPLRKLLESAGVQCPPELGGAQRERPGQ